MASVRAQLLLPFLQSPGQFVSGSVIGETLGQSRVSVHKHLEHLRADGFIFSATRNKGYRLEKEPDDLHSDLLEALQMHSPVDFYKSHLILKDIESTNSLAESELSDGRPSPFYIIANNQTAGRGRRGRTWHSPPDKNLYLSVALRPSMPPAKLQTITLWLGLRLSIFLRNEYSLPVQIKWPNDLFLHGKKFAGMLTEARVDSESTRDLVFGLGLNVNSEKADFPPELEGIAHSLSMELDRTVNMSRLAWQLLKTIATAMEDYLEDSFEEELAQNWPEFDYLRGLTIENGDTKGQVLGIARSGALRVQREDGTIAVLNSGEVTLGSNPAIG